MENSMGHDLENTLHLFNLYVYSCKQNAFVCLKQSTFHVEIVIDIRAPPKHPQNVA